MLLPEKIYVHVSAATHFIISRRASRKGATSSECVSAAKVEAFIKNHYTKSYVINQQNYFFFPFSLVSTKHRSTEQRQSNSNAARKFHLSFHNQSQRLSPCFWVYLFFFLPMFAERQKQIYGAFLYLDVVGSLLYFTSFVFFYFSCFRKMFHIHTRNC